MILKPFYYLSHFIMKKQIFTLLFICILSSLYADKRPNIVFIITDDQGYGDLGCHGNPIIKTPNIDEFYKDSIRLTDYHVSPTCSPTRGAIMCGQVTDKAGPWHTINGRSYLREEKTTIPDLLSESGYATAMFGKWHLGDNYPYRPQDRGFQHVLYHGAGGIGQTPDYYGNDYFDDTYFLNGTPKKYTGYCTDVFFDNAIEFIENHDKEKPFFVYLSTNAPHGPLFVEKKYEDMYPATYKGQKVPQKFFGMITNIDENFKKMDDKLKELGLRENTILIFTTDNGSAGGKNFYSSGMKGGKGSNYEGGHRVPFLMRWPAGNLDGGKDIDEMTAHVDLLPTFMDLTKTNLPKNLDLDGESIKPLLYNKSVSWLDRVLFTDSQRVYTPIKWKSTAVMSQKWRLLNENELYNIEKDPGQEKNVAAQFPETVQRLSKAYDAMWNKMEPGFAVPTYITVGTKYENPAVLTSHDWRGKVSPVPWNQGHIKKGVNSNGYWLAKFDVPGKYRFSLRRWAVEAKLPIDHLEKDKSLTDAKLYIDDNSWEGKIKANAEDVSFELEVEAGLRKLQTAFIEKGKEIRGAYYLVIEKI